MSNLDQNVYMAKVAESCERYNDLLDFLVPIIKEKGSKLTVEERNLFSLAAMCLVQSQKTALRILNANEKNAQNDKFLPLLAEYKRKIEDEIFSNCYYIINIIKNEILSTNFDDENENKVIFLKMIGDYCRHVAESLKDERSESAKAEGFSTYDKAYIFAKEHLHPSNLTRMSLVLNFSIIQYEMMKDVHMAIEIAEKAVQDALEKMDQIQEDQNLRDCQSVIQLLNENVELWKEELN